MVASIRDSASVRWLHHTFAKPRKNRCLYVIPSTGAGSFPARVFSNAMKELSRPEANAALEMLYVLARKRTGVTLLYASRNEVHNNATALKELIDGSRKPPTGTGPAATRGLQRARAGKRK